MWRGAQYLVSSPRSSLSNNCHRDDSDHGGRGQPSSSPYLLKKTAPPLFSPHPPHPHASPGWCDITGRRDEAGGKRGAESRTRTPEDASAGEFGEEEVPGKGTGERAWGRGKPGEGLRCGEEY